MVRVCRRFALARARALPALASALFSALVFSDEPPGRDAEPPGRDAEPPGRDAGPPVLSDEPSGLGGAPRGGTAGARLAAALVRLVTESGTARQYDTRLGSVGHLRHDTRQPYALACRVNSSA